MPQQASAAFRPVGPYGLTTSARRRRVVRGRPAGAIAVVAAVLAIAAMWVVLTRMRPSYDAFGWLVWGRQVLHWNLNTDGAPSWKPLTFLFTLPYALLGATLQLWLWMITATAAALAGAVFAARLAHRLAGPTPARPWARYVGATFAAVGVLGLGGYSQLVLIANSDPMVVTLCLAAIDAHLSNHRRLTFGLLVLVALGRPEGWAFALLYAVWLWRADPSTRTIATVGVALIPLAWFVVPALTSRSWFISGDLALNQATQIHGNKVIGVINRWRGLSGLGMQVAALASVALAGVRRDRTWLTLAGMALLWVVIEIGFAYHGWSAVPRYLIEPAAVMVVLVGAAVGQTLAYEPAWPGAARRTPVVLVVALIGALIPMAHSRVSVTHAQLTGAHKADLALDRLEAVIRSVGGPAAIKACGQPVSQVGYQSELAWAVGLNVGNVGYHPGKAIDSGKPIVLFKPYEAGWQVRPVNIPATDAPRCDRLRADSAMTPPS